METPPELMNKQGKITFLKINCINLLEKGKQTGGEIPYVVESQGSEGFLWTRKGSLWWLCRLRTENWHSSPRSP